MKNIELRSSIGFTRIYYITVCVCMLLLFRLNTATAYIREEGQHFQHQQDTNMTQTTIPATQLKKMAAYNTWANRQFAEWLQQADSTQWSMNIESSYNTLNLTLRHLWNAEHGWLSTLKQQPWTPAIEAEQNLSKDEMLRGFLQTSLEFQQFVEQLTEEEFSQTRTLGKDKKQVSLGDIIQHVFNHATYHRGQLITMGRQAGLSTPPRTDYIYFIMQ